MSVVGGMSPEFAAYYDMWTDRFARGSLSRSLAIHYGYVEDPAQPFDVEDTQLATNEIVADALGLPFEGSHVIADLGCGVGGPARYMSDRFPDARILAVNIHQPQLELMQTLPPTPSDRIVPVLGDFTKLAFEDGSLDGAYAIESSCYATDKMAFYEGVLRVLRTGARLVIWDVFQGRTPTSDEEYGLYAKSMRGWVVPSWHDPNVQIPGATTDYRDVTENVLPAVTSSRDNIVDKFKDTVNPVMRDQVDVIVGAHACLTSGLVRYGLLTITKES